MNRAVAGCLPYAALALVGALVWPFMAGSILAKLVLAAWVVGFGMVSLAVFRQTIESRDAYDLKRLRRLHEREEMRRADVPAVSRDAREVVCPRCGGASDVRRATCSHCGSNLP